MLFPISIRSSNYVLCQCYASACQSCNASATCVIAENKQLQFLSIVTTVYFFCLYFSPSSVPVSSFGIDFTDRIVSPALVVNQHVYCPPFPVTKETPVSLAIAWIHVQKQIHVQKPLCFCFSLPITNRCPFVTLLFDITC